MVSKDLIKFVKEARKQGYDDYQIKRILLKHGWHVHELEDAFSSLKIRPKFKNKVCIYLDSDVLKAIEKRAKKNMLTIPEQIEDVLRRSVVNTLGRRSMKPENLDDMLVGIFSRKTRRRR